MINNLTFADSLLVSVNGLVVVFTILVILAFSTLLIAKVLNCSSRREKAPVPATAAVTTVVADIVNEPEEDMGDILAVLQGAISMESGIPVDQFMVKSVTERAQDGK